MDPSSETYVGHDLELLRTLYRYAQVGRCVSSVTHDTNNLLGAISAYAELIGLDESLSPDARRMLQEILSGVNRCSDLINTLTSVARKERRDVLMMPLSLLVDRVLDLRRYDMKAARIKLSTSLATGMPSRSYDRAMIEMALIYLITNAIEALEHEQFREIKVGTRIADGETEVSIWNSGPPIESSVQERIFEPFFTTKGAGHPGLGLYLAREAAQAHGGNLTYDREHGFVMTLQCDKRG
jgi:signal transduction histidine kinase